MTVVHHYKDAPVTGMRVRVEPGIKPIELVYSDFADQPHMIEITLIQGCAENVWWTYFKEGNAASLTPPEVKLLLPCRWQLAFPWGRMYLHVRNDGRELAVFSISVWKERLRS